MKELKFRVWHRKEKKMYWRGYQKLTHVLLCDNDRGANEGRGTPLKRASYEDCELLEGTTFFDKHRREVYEGDVVRILYKGKGEAVPCPYIGVVTYVPDMFGSKSLHPLESVLIAHGIQGNPSDLEAEILGNRFENSTLI